uniref:Uncharacterized protein n=1 Tax=Arundo donax TaxID=35708 RepID=A0A0A9FFC2_ARUDO
MQKRMLVTYKTTVSNIQIASINQLAGKVCTRLVLTSRPSEYDLAFPF